MSNRITRFEHDNQHFPILIHILLNIVIEWVAKPSFFGTIDFGMPISLPFWSGSSSRVSVRLGSREILPWIRVPFHLSDAQLASHLHVMGRTGQGKSKFLAHLATQLIRQGRGCAVIDPHADLAHDILALLVDSGFFRRTGATQRVLFVDLSHPETFIPFNVLKTPYPTPEIARHLVEACTRAWPALADGQAPQFENLLLASAVVLIENGLPVTEMTALLTNQPYREQLLSHVSDPQVVAFFHDRFDQWGKDAPMLIESTLRRIFLLSFTPALRYTLGQTENALNFRALMDQGTSIIFNLGGLDEQTQKMLGCLISVGFETATLLREDTPEHQRRPYHLLMDEFSMFSAQSEESLARVVSLARKYKLFLTLAHQTWSQLSERLHGALQNSTPLYFRLGFDDAAWAAPRLSDANPYSIKHEVRPLTRELSMEYHPSYLSLPEQDRLMAQHIEGLWPRQAFVKIERKIPRLLRHFLKHTKTVKITTAKVLEGRD